MTLSFRLREPLDALCAVPVLLGYHPADCIVVIGLRGLRLHLTLRQDLAAPSDPEAPGLDDLVESMSRNGITGALLVGYGPEERVRPTLLALRQRCELVRISVQELLRTEGARYWSYLCQDAACCPAAGTPYDATTSAIMARATLAGYRIWPDFASYTAQLEPLPRTPSMEAASGRASLRLLELLRDARGERDAERRLVRAAAEALDAGLHRVEDGEPLDEDAIAWLAAVVIATAARDTCWLRIDGRSTQIQAHRDLWCAVMRGCDTDLLPAPACLFAFAAWQCGESRLASMALDRVLDVDQAYSMALLIRQALAAGLPPSVWHDRSQPQRRARRQPRTAAQPRPVTKSRRKPGRGARTRSSSNPGENRPA